MYSSTQEEQRPGCLSIGRNIMPDVPSILQYFNTPSLSDMACKRVGVLRLASRLFCSVE